MSKSRKTDISSLFDYSIEVSDKLEKKLSHANKQNKRKKKNRKIRENVQIRDIISPMSLKN